MASTRTKRGWWRAYRCTPGALRVGGFFGRGPVYEQDIIHEAVSALEAGHIGAGYRVHNNGYIGSKRNCPAGIGGRKCEQNGDNCSLHNYCIAFDIEYQYNKLSPSYPSRVDPWTPFEFQFHTYEKDVFEKIENIRNLEGKALFRWLGFIGDYMHWEIDVPPDEVSVDWTTVPGFDSPPVDKEEIVLERGDKGVAVADYQDLILKWDSNQLPVYKDDGDFGGETEVSVRAFQASQDLDNTGKIDGVTAASLRGFAVVQGSVGPAGPAGPKGPHGNPGPPGEVSVLINGEQVA